jgi:inositol phosphorylceramide mannosyltransferase catalytic subunit
VIPRVFHQIWVGPDPVLDGFEEWRASWARHHPDWEQRLWVDGNLPPDLRNREVYELDRHPVERADILRLELLFRFGGVYLDADLECLKPIDPLIDGLDFFGMDIKPGRFTNTVIGSVAGHPILDRALSEVTPQEPGARFDKTKSGPVFLDGVVKQFSPPKTFPRATFYPITEEEHRQAYSIHHCARTWKSREEWRIEALRAEVRLRRLQAELEQERREHLETKEALADSRRKQLALKDKLRHADGQPGSD